MKIPMEIFSHILGFLSISELGLMDTAFLNKGNRPYFLEILKQQKVAVITSFEIVFQMNFVKWVKKRDIYFEVLTFHRPSMFMLNSMICFMKDSIRSLTIRGGISCDSMLIISLLCKNLRELRYFTHDSRLITNDDHIEDEEEEQKPDLFREVDVDMLKNLEILSVKNCSNYGLLILTLYGRKLRYLRIDNVKGLNEHLLYDLVLFLADCHIEIDLISSIRVNASVVSRRIFDKKLVLEVDSYDTNIANENMLRRLFYRHTNVDKLTIHNFTVMKRSQMLLDHVNRIDNLILRGRIISLCGLPDLLVEKKVTLLKLVFMSNPMSLCIGNIISFFEFWEEQENDVKYIDISIEYNNLGTSPVEFSKLLELIELLERRMRRGVRIKINHKILRLENKFWKNDVNQIFIL